MWADGPEQGASAPPPETTPSTSSSTIDNSLRDATKRHSSPAGPLETFYRNHQIPKSKSYQEPQYVGRVSVRHRDADEALSSLLWQPYECRGSPPLSQQRQQQQQEPQLHRWPGVGSSHSPAVGRDGETSNMRIQVPAADLVDGSVHGVVVTDEDDKDLRCGRQCSAVSVNGEVMSACRTQPAARNQLHSQQTQQSEAAGVQQHQAVAPQVLPPPYSTLPPPHAHHPLPLPVQPHAYPFQPISLRRCQYGEDSESPKTCCGGMGSRALSLRWFIAIVALAGVCCVLVGTVLGAVRSNGRAHLTVLLLMIGVGLVLVTVSGVAWRAAGRRANSINGSGANRTASSGPRRTALPCARAHHPYAAMLYPEFHCRPPPPSYQASMHEYRLRLLLLDRATSPPPVTCPPPAYRPRRMVNVGPQIIGGRGTRGRRRPEQQPPPSISAVVIQNIGLESYDDIKYDNGPEMEPHIVGDSKDDVQQENKEGNLVTIVQTGEDTSPVIVTVSGSIPEERPSQIHTSEIDILAHL